MNKRKSLLKIGAISSAIFISLALGCADMPKQVVRVSAPVAAATDQIPQPAAPQSPPVINSFTVTPATIETGQKAVLNWDVAGARELTIAPAIGSSGTSSISKGSEPVSPSSTTTYILTASNELGSVTRSATVTVTGSGDRTVGFDPVSGRNDEIDLNWEQLCLANEYQVQFAKDPEFSIIVLDTGPFPRIDPASRGFSPADPTSPGAYFPSGGRVGVGSPYNSAIGFYGLLEAGHTYYVRFRATRTATGQIMISPWSPTYRYTVKSGLPASPPSYGPQPLSPTDRCTGCPVSPVAFSWSPFKDTTKYRFQLAKDAAMSQIVVQADTPTTAYQYAGTLDYDTSYFWRVMAVEPAPSDWSAVFTFRTTAAPVPPAPVKAAEVTPLWAWVIIAVGTALAITVVVMLFLSRQRKA